jgi:hypothetical protein
LASKPFNRVFRTVEPATSKVVIINGEQIVRIELLKDHHQAVVYLADGNTYTFYAEAADAFIGIVEKDVQV